jgi:hypothetical protein
MTHRFLQAASTARRILFFLSATPTSNLTHLDEPTMENKETIICWFYNDKSSFHVDICPEKTISHLKEAILAKEPSISVTSASQLQLWVANIDDTEEAMGSFSFDGLKVLRGSDEIKKHFLRGFVKNTIHFAIERPGKQHSFILSTHIC